MAANGMREDDGRDRSNYYSETIVIPSREAKAKTASSKKTSSPKYGSQKNASGRTHYTAPSNIQKNSTLRRNKRIAAICITAVSLVLVLCIGIAAWFYFTSTADNGLIMANTYVAGINIGNMTPENAKVYLQNRIGDALFRQSITISLPDASLELHPEDTNIKLDLDLLIADVYRLGREGSRSERVAAMAAAALSKQEIGLLSYMTLDTSYIRSSIEDFHANTANALTGPAVSLQGQKPSDSIPESEDAAQKVYQQLTVTLGTQGLSFDTEALYERVLDAYDQNDLSPIHVDYTVEEPDPVDLDALVAQYCTAAVNAQLNTDDYTVSDEIWGYGFDPEGAANLLKAAEQGQTITLSLRYQEPEVTRAKLESSLFQDELASADTIYYLNPDRTSNLILACKAIDNYIVKPGESFSFNEVLGERTPEKGYKPAGAYVDGETVDQVGGGICQVASTLYYCALYADLEILEREEHMFTADYLPLGMDATVNWGTLDFRFRNNTDYPIRITAKAEDSYVSITLLGTDDKDYYIEMEYKVLDEYQWETVEKLMKEDNEDGYVDGETIQSGWMGYSVDTYRCKYSKQTDELISRTPESHSEYSKRDKLVCKIDKPTTDTSSPSTDAPETAPPSAETEPPTETEPTEAEPTETIAPETTSPEAESSAPTDPPASGTDDLPDAIG